MLISTSWYRDSTSSSVSCNSLIFIDVTVFLEFFYTRKPTKVWSIMTASFKNPNFSPFEIAVSKCFLAVFPLEKSMDLCIIPSSINVLHALKYPWVANGCSTDHYTVNTVLVFVLNQLFRMINIAIAKNRNFEPWVGLLVFAINHNQHPLDTFACASYRGC